MRNTKEGLEYADRPEGSVDLKALTVEKISDDSIRITILKHLCVFVQLEFLAPPPHATAFLYVESGIK